jgi:hypothetical protein
MSDERIFGTAKDGKEFDAESQEVKDYLAQYPDVTLEAAIGSVIEDYNRTLEPVSPDSPAEDEAEDEAEEADDEEAGEEDLPESED